MQSLAKQESLLPVPADNRSQAARRPQFGDAWQDIAKLEADLWSAADNLRANSKLTSSDYFMPVLGVIFLRHAQNRFDAATRQIEFDSDLIRIAKMNLAVHGLSGKIAEAITYYQDEHGVAGRCGFVMANPPFNVDLVDAERAETDKRLPFGLPGVNKAKKVANANYLWISYFYSYLNDTGRAGFVMSSQASSAGHAERDLRRRIVQSGAVDAMLAVRSGFFYTRSVPCELWFFDRAKPKARADSLLMLDARNVFRQVTRKINDFSPEQLSNLTAIVWLHRGQTDRFLGLVSAYLERLYAEADEVPMALDDFDLGVDALRKPCAEPRRRTPTENSAPRTKRPCARPWRRLTRPTAPTSPRAMPCSRCCNTKAAPRQRSRTTTPDSMPLARSSTPRPRP